MALRDVRRRIRSVKNTAQITTAMEVVAATKMRRSQGVALAGRPYALAALDILKNVARRSPVRPHLLEPREVKKTLLLVIASDRGLAGAFNSNVVRLAERWIREHRGEPYACAAVGKKVAASFAARGLASVKTFVGFGDYVARSDTEPLAAFLLGGFLRKEWDRVTVFYTNFRTTLKQEVRMIEVLPIHTERIEETIRGIAPEYGRYAEIRGEGEAMRYRYEYIFEPSPEAVLERLLPILFKIQLHHLVLESNASEHSARMIAMKNASDNARELVGELALAYHKARQAGITRELSEITGSTEAVST